MSKYWRFKRTLPCFPHNGEIILGDDLKTIRDSDGSIYKLLMLADGTKTTNELAKLVSKNNKKTFTSNEIDHACEQLTSLGWMNDAALYNPERLPKTLRERFRVNINFFDHKTVNKDPFYYQDKLRKSKVTLLGLGGGGSNILMHLAGLGIQDIIGVDFDKVELSNLNRQPLYAPEDIGMYKAEAAAKWMKRFYPESSFQPRIMAVKSTEDALSITEGRDLLIVAADEPVIEMRQWVNEAAVKTGVPFIVGGIQSHTAHYEMIKPGVTPCWECIQKGIRKTHENWDDILDVVTHRKYRSQSVIMPYMGILTSFIATDALNYLSEICKPFAWGKRVSFDFMNGGMSIIDEWHQDSDCPVCKSVQKKVSEVY